MIRFKTWKECLKNVDRNIPKSEPFISFWKPIYFLREFQRFYRRILPKGNNGCHIRPWVTGNKKMNEYDWQVINRLCQFWVFSSNIKSRCFNFFWNHKGTRNRIAGIIILKKNSSPQDHGCLKSANDTTDNFSLRLIRNSVLSCL